MTTSRVVLSILTITAASLGIPVKALQTSETLSATHHIEEAIKLGRHAGAMPYELLWRNSEQEAGQTVIGAVYTPFLRVAMWVRQHHKDDVSLEVSDIPSELVNPTVTVALQQEPPCCPAVESGRPVRVFAALVRAPGRLTLLCDDELARGQIALSATTDLASLRLFDPRQADHTSAIITIPLTRVRSGWDIIYETHRRESGGAKVLHFTGVGMIRDAEISRWR